MVRSSVLAVPNYSQVFREFRGRGPKIDALLRHSGLDGASVSNARVAAALAASHAAEATSAATVAFERANEAIQFAKTYAHKAQQAEGQSAGDR